MAFRVLNSLALLLALSIAPSQATEAGQELPITEKHERTVAQAVAYLQAAQADDGSFSGHAGPGVTALTTAALLQNGRTTNDPIVVRGLRYLEKHVQPDGGVYQPGTLYRNYETCLAIMCFVAANGDGRYDIHLDDAERFLKQLQWDDEEGHDTASMSFGGAGYGRHKRPDLSNTGFFVEALHALGDGPDDQAMQRALAFVSRCQNLETEHNTSPHAAKVNDGGFYYTVAAGGSSQAGETAEGGLLSYGSMTYVGLKSMIYAGVDADDPRVQAARRWIAKHYTLDENPGMGSSGLYYYYHTFAKALDATGSHVLLDDKGDQHDWKADLIHRLAEEQRSDGSWVNENQRWLESDPNLVTAYCLLALSYCQPEGR